MKKEEAEAIYNNAKNNSIGKEKKSSAQRFKRNVILSIATAALVTVLASAGFLAMHKNKEELTDSPDRIEYVTEIDGYNMSDLSIYQNLRVYDLLDNYGFTDYNGSGYNRTYNYTEEDFQRLKGINENYLYGFYCATSEQNFKDVLSVFGYDSLDSYLIDRNYVDKQGNPSIDAWNDATMQEMANILKSEKGKAK